MAKKFTEKVAQAYLNPAQVRFMLLMTAQFLTDFNETKHHNWNEEALKYRKEMHDAAVSLKLKFERMGFDVSDFDPYKPGDEDEFIKK